MRRTTVTAGLALILTMGAAPAQAQDSVTVTANARYQKGALHRLLWGGEYRDLWATPLRVPVLRPDTFAGGLTPLRAGGGLATESLHMRGADGLEYVFRSVDKNAERGLPEDAHHSLVASIAQDQVANKHPGAALVVEPILAAAGILHPVPALYVMPDDPFLGEFRARFAGRLGMVEVRPEDEKDSGGASYLGADRVIGAERLLERLEASPRERLDAREYLRARLVDMLVGDWDRHLDQWRFAGFKSGDDWRWRPIPRDRDNAFNDNAGLLMIPVRAAFPQLTTWGPRYGNVFGLVKHASDLDRVLLSELEWPAWDSAARFVQARVTDAVIARATGAMPPEYRAESAAGLASDLRMRRDSLGTAARAFYLLLASDVDVHATDEDERAEVVRRSDGGVDVVIRSEGIAAPLFRRRFDAGETREVRLYLQGGDDRAVVRGTSRGGIQVRLIGGGGDDALADSSAAGARMTVLHDDRGDNELVRGRGTVVDTREYDPAPPKTVFGNPPSPRDWGSDQSYFTPWGAWQANVGPILGVGPTWTRYGFRRQPYARQIAVRALYAPLEDGIGVEALADFKRTSTGGGLRMRAGARTFDMVRFHGFGNESPGEGEERYEVTQDELVAEASMYSPLGRRAWWSVGPSVRWRDPRNRETLLDGVRGGDGVLTAGVAGEIRIDGRDTLPVTRRGWWARATGGGFGSDAGGPFGRAGVEGRAYLPVGSGGPVLAVRAGGEAVRGDAPFQESAFLGGYGSLRGAPFQRYAGDAAVYGGAELRQPIGQVRLLLRGRVGAFGFAEGGRVYVDGESPGDWHPTVGAGAWFESLGQVATLTWAHGDMDRLYLGLGLPF